MEKPTHFETDVLKVIRHCGGRHVNLAGPRFNARTKAAARECLRKGLLRGEPTALDLTDAGHAALRAAA